MRDDTDRTTESGCAGSCGEGCQTSKETPYQEFIFLETAVIPKFMIAGITEASKAFGDSMLRIFLNRGGEDVVVVKGTIAEVKKQLEFK